MRLPLDQPLAPPARPRGQVL